jgi:hypothetical protein
MLALMWRDPVIEVYKQHVDRTLLRENLRLTVEERFRKLMELQRFAEELQRAGREAVVIERRDEPRRIPCCARRADRP